MDTADMRALPARRDKWFVGGGRSVVYAPPFPLWDRVPGFWDGVHIADQHVPTLFCVIILDDAWQPIDWRWVGRRWTPEALEQHWVASGWRLRERRVIAPPDVCASHLELRLTRGRPRRVHVVWWSRQRVRADDAGYSLLDADVRDGRAALSLRLADGTPLAVSGGFDVPTDSYQLQLAEDTVDHPLWRVAPFGEKVRDGRLACERNVRVGVLTRRPGDGGHPGADGVLHVGLHRACQVVPGESVPMEAWASLAFGAAPPQPPDGAVILRSRTAWEEFLDDVPAFSCNDPAIETYYWYRWWGLRLHMIDPRARAHQHPSVVEGIDGFRRHISYSAQCHLWETSWLCDPGLARGIMRNMIANQHANGMFPGSIALAGTGGFYHADWSHVWQVHQLHPDEDFLREVYGPLARYVEYMRSVRDHEGWHLFDVLDQGETGQEYMGRYLAADPHADDWRRIQLKGVGETVYVYQIARCLARIARLIGESAAGWDREADLIREAIRGRTWDAAEEWFCDLVPPDGHRSPAHAATSFYPFLCDVAGPDHLGAIRRHLLNPNEFWTPWPIPAEGAAEPTFDPEAAWKRKRMSCPWNGRNWPMATCHAAEALARASDAAPDLAPAAADLIRRFVRMMSYGDDPARPNCFEHYNPYTGAPSEYRGVDDYQHSWVVDLIIKYVAGVRPQDDDRLVVDPLPFGLRRFSLDGVRYRGHDVSVTWRRGEGLAVSVDGRERARSPRLARLVVPL